MEFKHLQSFAAVVQHKSFTKAAESLFLSQPTISTHIQQLEEELHTNLVVRTTKTLEITEMGQQIYEYCMNILELKERIKETCSTEQESIIHLGASTIPSAYILPHLLPQFAKYHPNIYFVIHQSDSQGVIDKLKDGIFDIGLIGMKIEDEDFACIPFCEDRMILITPVTEHFLALKQENELDLREILKEPIILREKGSGSKKSANRFLQKLEISENDLTIAARVNDQEAIKNLVAEGVGISIISEKAAQNFIDARRLIGFSLPDSLATRELYVVYHKNQFLKHTARQFVEYILKV